MRGACPSPPPPRPPPRPPTPSKPPPAAPPQQPPPDYHRTVASAAMRAAPPQSPAAHAIVDAASVLRGAQGSSGYGAPPGAAAGGGGRAAGAAEGRTREHDGGSVAAEEAHAVPLEAASAAQKLWAGGLVSTILLALLCIARWRRIAPYVLPPVCRCVAWFLRRARVDKACARTRLTACTFAGPSPRDGPFQADAPRCHRPQSPPILTPSPARCTGGAWRWARAAHRLEWDGRAGRQRGQGRSGCR